jgi:SAM-dependent methyltransferase
VSVVAVRKIFTQIYKESLWGDNDNPNYSGSSGQGSDTGYNILTYVPFLKKFITDNNIKKIVDLGCGDFYFGELIYKDLDVNYLGIDVYEEMIDYLNNKYPYSFQSYDFFKFRNELPDADLFIIKDVFQHWDNKSIIQMLDFLIEERNFKYILVCNGANQTEETDIKIGEYRPLNHTMYPLNKYDFQLLYSWDIKDVLLLKSD